MSKTKKIAITGSIGAGKSEVSSYLKRQGEWVVSADEIVHDLYQQDEFCSFLQQDEKECFVLENRVDKTKLKHLILEDEQLKKRIEFKVHSAVLDTINQILRSNTTKDRLFVEVPLLFESHWEKYFDQIICVIVDETVQKQRLLNKRNMSGKEMKRWIDLQMSQEEKCLRSDVVFENSKDLKSLHDQIRVYLEKERESRWNIF